PRRTGYFVLGFRRLPERKVLSILLRIIVLDYAGAGFHFARVQAREFSVTLELVDGEIDGSIVGLIRELPVYEALDNRDHLRNVVRRLRIQLGVLDPQKRAIGVKDLRDRRSDFGDSRSLLAGRLDDLVVDIGEIHHLVHLPAAQRNDTAKQILEQKRAEVAEVGGTVNGRTAVVDWNRLDSSGRN